jgi:deoxyribose-phosphate aldolase
MKLSKYIDHTLLKPEATQADVEKICKEAVEHDFASVMVNPCWIPFVKEQVKGTDVLAACVIGFPLGANTTAVKVFEVKDAVANGADEVDMVINIGQLKAGNDKYVTDEIRQLKEAAGSHCLKVIIETCLLTDDEKKRACKCVVDAGADFVKTSTGFSTGGATVADVKLMKAAVEGSSVKVKASGGVRSPEDFQAMIDAGAERIGTSSGCKLVE